MSENNLSVLNESSQINYLNNLNQFSDLNNKKVDEDEMKKDLDKTKLNNEFSKNLFTVDSLLKSENHQTTNEDHDKDVKNECKNNLENNHDEMDTRDDEPIDNEDQVDDSTKSEQDEELNVDRDDQDDQHLIERQKSSCQTDQSDEQINQIKNDYKSIEELYKSSNSIDLFNNNQSINANNQLHNPSTFLSQLPFSNHNPHFQALITHLAPYTSALNAAYFNNLNNLIHPSSSFDTSGLNPSTVNTACQQTPTSTNSLQSTSSSTSKLSPSSLNSLPACSLPTSFNANANTSLEDNLRQALLAAQSTTVNTETVSSTLKHGHSLNLISLNNSSKYQLILIRERFFDLDLEFSFVLK